MHPGGPCLQHNSIPNFLRCPMLRINLLFTSGGDRGLFWCLCTARTADRGGEAQQEAEGKQPQRHETSSVVGVMDDKWTLGSSANRGFIAVTAEDDDSMLR
ncbi:hypothetical protein EYF80_012456 [Liparis tanakae]|uniref:Uncharacterized protein n=1 Tax=Liparis tanakae TaxID=230148 RepID=A0A4Z2IJC2_9TELE|nr:hypothetical protein EYF80_012456 [Liparis tanakae]